MKTRITRIGMLALSIGWLASCQQHDVTPGSTKDLSEFAKKYLGMHSAASQASTLSQSGMMNNSYGAMNNYVNTSGGSFSADASDTTIVTNPGICGTSTYIQNQDGSTTQIFDYGDSCVQSYDNYKFVQSGKATSTYKNSYVKEGTVYTGQYFYKSTYENFGNKYYSKDYNSSWLSNGYYYYSGESRYDTLSQEYSGSSESRDSSVYVYNGVPYSNRGSGVFTYSNKKSIQQSSSYEYAEGDNFYRSEVTVPVVTDYSCNQNNYQQGGPVGICYMLIPVSGHVVVNYKQDGVTGQFEIDYGNGECDALITITENGKTIVIDMGNLYTLLAAG